MQNNAGLKLEISTTSNVTSFVQCVLELVANSLAAHAAAIAIRIHAGKREVQVIDNGIGIPEDMLKRIAEYDARTAGNQQRYELTESNDRTLTNIHRLSDSLTIASRHQYSMETFMKVFKMGSASNLMQIEQRPSRGTTVSVYGFREVPMTEKWDLTTICFLIAAIAVAKLEVSFSIRDEERKKVVLKIAKPHSPIEVLRMSFGKDLPLNHLWLIQRNPEYNVNYHGYIGVSDKYAPQWIFLNHKPICCPLILHLINVGFKERLNLTSDQKSNAQGLYDKNMFILLFLTFSQEKFKFFTEDGKRYAMFHDMQKILSSIRNCAFKRLAEETADAAISYLYKTQLLKQIYSKTERSVCNNSINVHNKNVTSLKRNRIVTIGFKRKKVTSTIITSYFNKQHNKNDDITTSRYVEEENSELNSIQCQVDNNSTKHTNLCEGKVANMRDDVDKTQASFTNLDSTESNKAYLINYHNDNNNIINMISPLSEWSDWTYHTDNKERNPVKNLCNAISEHDVHYQRFFECNNRFNFLPRKLYGLLQYRHVKLTNVKCFNSPDNAISLMENWGREQITVHPCNWKQKLCELRLSRASLKCIKIINQVNDEFIAALMMYDEMKILLMIDQHAVHERIRYENLLLRYKVQNESELLSINLRNPLAMEFPTETYDLLLCNKMLLKQYGISLGSLKKNTLLIRTIPQCLVANNDHCNNSEKILPKIRGLLNDILKNRNTTNHVDSLPLTIHNSIASEACHGAIKFGDKLTLEQCTCLMKLLKYTKFPNRCAHGRPTIIPVMELSELKKRSVRRISEGKLNFASLKKHH